MHMRILLVCFLTLMLPLTLSSCSLFAPEKPPAKKKSPKKPKPGKSDEAKDGFKEEAAYYDGQDYILNLSLAKLSLSHSSDEGKTIAAPFLQTLHAYTTQPVKAEGTSPIVAVEYKEKGKSTTQWVLIPLEAETLHDASLSQVMTRLNSLPHVIHNIRPLRIPVIAALDTSLSEENPHKLRETLDRTILQMMQKMQAMPADQEAALQLKLSRYFMDRKNRDAAYLSLENAKQLLAKLSQGKEKKSEKVAALTRDMEVLEDQLHRALPFTL